METNALSNLSNEEVRAQLSFWLETTQQMQSNGEAVPVWAEAKQFELITEWNRRGK